MNQLANTYIERALVTSRQDDLLRSRTSRVARHVGESGLIRRSMGSALIRIGLAIRGQSTRLTASTEDDREIALRLAA